MTLAFRRRATASIAVGICAASCGRIGFDLLPQDSLQAVSNDAAAGTGGAGPDGAAGAPISGGAGGASSGGRSGSGGATSSGGAGYGGTSSGGVSGSGSGGTTDASAPDGAGGSLSGGAPGTGGAGGTSSGGVSSTGGSGPDAGPPPVCASTSGTIQVWSFNSTVENWAYWPNLGPGTLSWTAATGNPTAGALSVDVTSGSGLLGWIVFDSPTPNLSGHTGSVWLYADLGTVDIKLYAQSNRSTYTWADGGFMTLPPKTWTCVSINFSAPVYNDAGFDPTNIVRWGVELGGTGPVRVYADQFAY